jgi:hypothetical protein
VISLEEEEACKPRIFRIHKGDKQFAQFNLLFPRCHLGISLQDLFRSPTGESQGISDLVARLPELPKAPKACAGPEADAPW